MARKFLITSGFNTGKAEMYPWKEGVDRHHLMKGVGFNHLWVENILKYVGNKSDFHGVTIINSTKNLNPDDYKSYIRMLDNWENNSINSIKMTDNFGHQVGEIKGQYCGWTRAWLLGMYYAYMNDCDHIFVEQDVLCFGDWVDEIYRESEEKNLGIMFGKKEYGGVHYQQECGLSFIRKEHIPTYLSCFKDLDKIDKEMGAEHKIAFVNSLFGNLVGSHPFGYGFLKPERFNDDSTFYGHRWSFADIKKLVELNLIDSKYIIV